jgi:hypothetical protein
MASAKILDWFERIGSDKPPICPRNLGVTRTMVRSLSWDKSLTELAIYRSVSVMSRLVFGYCHWAHYFLAHLQILCLSFRHKYIAQKPQM